MSDNDSTLAQFDQACAERLEKIYLTPDVVHQREQIFQWLDVKPGMQALDIGCGPGLTTVALAQAVGPAGHIDAIDIAPPMLQLAARRCDSLKQVALHQADVLHLPFEQATFDVALATQVYEYVADIDGALRELWRVMKPGAQVLLVDTDWESCVWASRDDARMRRVMEGWSQHIPHPQLPRYLLQRLQRAGFAEMQVHTVPLVNTRYDLQTFSGGMMGFIASFVGGLPDFGEQLVTDWQADVSSMGEVSGYFFSLNRYVFVARKPIA
ncbi:MAG: methyltransferase domain-containing protein [Limnohabitans sp.]